MTPCVFCQKPLTHLVVSLGASPLSNAFLTADQLPRMEPFYPLDVYVCDGCFLVQLGARENPERLFNHYAYFSSYSETWLAHASAYVDKVIPLLGLGAHSHVVEIASNDGYLLQYFVAKGIPVLGVEPARNIAAVARGKGIPTDVMFFGADAARRLAAEGKSANLLLGNNVLAHVPALNDFVAGLKILLKPAGVITMEFPHLMRLIDETQFDTIYHEHVSYFSLAAVDTVFAAHGLTVFDVEELSTHGGSLRIYVRHQTDAGRPVSQRVRDLIGREREAGYAGLARYAAFSDRVKAVKRDILAFMIQAKADGKTIVGYGAPAKGNTLLNYCGIRTDFIDYTVDRNDHKQGLFLPGTRIPIEAPEKIRETRPDYVFILPWNLKNEIMQQMACIREWGGRFVTPIPRLEVS